MSCSNIEFAVFAVSRTFSSLKVSECSQIEPRSGFPPKTTNLGRGNIRCVTEPWMLDPQVRNVFAAPLRVEEDEPAILCRCPPVVSPRQRHYRLNGNAPSVDSRDLYGHRTTGANVSKTGESSIINEFHSDGLLGRRGLVSDM